MLDLRGKSVWITGASAGLGEALAERFAQQGARLLLSARRVEKLHAVARAARASGAPDVQVLPLDLAELDSLASKGAEALALMGGVDVMVHNAGLGQRALVSESSFDVDKRLMDVNFLGPIALTKSLLPSMVQRQSGAFVVISSVLGLMSVKRRAAYCASKHALHGYFNALRAEVHGQGIRVLMVCPGHIDSEFSQQALEADGKPHGVNDAGNRAGLSPAACADRTLRGLLRGEAEIYPAKWETLGLYLNRLSPALTRFAIAGLKAR